MNWFSKWLFCIIAACFLIGCASTSEKQAQVATQPSAQAQAEQGGTPVADLTETGFDFGSVNTEANLTHEFKVKNTGNGVLVIKKVLPG